MPSIFISPLFNLHNQQQINVSFPWWKMALTTFLFSLIPPSSILSSFFLINFRFLLMTYSTVYIISTYEWNPRMDHKLLPYSLLLPSIFKFDDELRWDVSGCYYYVRVVWMFVTSSRYTARAEGQVIKGNNFFRVVAAGHCSMNYYLQSYLIYISPLQTQHL